MLRHPLSRNSRFILIVLYFVIGFIFIIKANCVTGQRLSFQYYFVLFSYFISFGYWIYNIFKFGFYLFEPVTMVASLTIITFSIEPLLSILNNDINLMDFYVFDGCIKATVIYLFAICLFLFIYYNNFKIIDGNSDNEKLKNEYNVSLNQVYKKSTDDKIIMSAYIFGIIGTFVMLIDTLQSGYSMEYIFSWGSQGNLSEASETRMGSLINLRYVSAVAFLYLDAYDKRKWPVTILRVIMMFSLLVRTTRWFLIVLIISPLVFNYVKTKKTVNYKYIVFVGVLVSVLIGVMQFTRVQIRDGYGAETADWSSFSFYTIWLAFSGNFDLYKTLYGAVSYFPQEHFYTMGQQLIYLTLVTCIPRSIWPAKPYSIIDSKLKMYFLGSGAVRGHWAYAQMTELYIEFGVIGVLVGYVIFARFCKQLRLLYEEKRSIHDLVSYSVMFPMLMQLVIRGYMPINFWAMFFMLLPVFIIKKIKIGELL